MSASNAADLLVSHSMPRMPEKSMMKWRVTKENRFSLIEHEDIRRSLEVLDNVLAEFDDCIDAWCFLPPSPQFGEMKWGEKSLDATQLSAVRSFHSKYAAEDCCSRHSAPGQSPPPPLPKRRPVTEWKRHSSSLQPDDTRPDSCESFRSATPGDNTPLSILDHVHITPLSPEKNDDSGIFDNVRNDTHDCGCNARHSCKMDLTATPEEISPFLQRWQAFEDRIHASASSLTRKSPQAKSGGGVLTAIENTADSMQPDTSPLDCSTDCEEEIYRLRLKFHRVRELLRQNKIKALNREPPTFIPAPPSPKDSVSHSQRALHQNAENSPPVQAEYSPVCNCSPVQSTFHPGAREVCSNISLSSINLSPTAEDIPNLLPTDVLGRPQLGMSYSLEEDLSPGVKEIRQTSTPKSDVSSASLFQARESGILSTFSSSRSCLGYVSSQSELEINLLEVPDKVPMSSFKSVTLPNGSNRFPYYSSSQEDNSHFLKRYNSQKVHDTTRDNMHRNSSGSRKTSPEKSKKSHFPFRGFSRKEKKDKSGSFS